MQGKGWEIATPERSQSENLDIFMMVKRLFDLENPKAEPQFEQFKTTIKRTT